MKSDIRPGVSDIILARLLACGIYEFRGNQVVRPLTQQIINKKTHGADELWFGPGLEGTRITTVNEPRIKRQAISAEPLNIAQGGEMHIVKIPKCQK